MYHIKIDLGKLAALNPNKGKTAAPKAILSPCVGICQLSGAGLCEGCYRSSAEIAQWSAMSDAERAHIMDVLLPMREAS